MNEKTTRIAFLQGDVTRDEAADLIVARYLPTVISRTLVDSWQKLADLERQIEAFKQHADPPRLGHSLVAQLIDYAFCASRISALVAREYHTRNGMLYDVASEHIAALEAAKNDALAHDAHLDNPETETRYCTRCGIKVTKKALSTRGICWACNDAAQDANILQLHQKRGPYYEHWLGRTLGGLQILAGDLADAKSDAALEQDTPPPTVAEYEKDLIGDREPEPSEHAPHLCDGDCDPCPYDPMTCDGHLF